MSLWRCATCGDYDKRHYIEKCMRCGGHMVPADGASELIAEEAEAEK